MTQPVKPIAIVIALGALIGLSMLLFSSLYAEPEYIHVAGPFYLTYFKTRDQMSLFRCPTGPRNGAGCTSDGLPDATVFAAGADDRYVVVARHPHGTADVTQYFYFARIVRRREAWGSAPAENVIGPMSEQAFDAAKAKLGLPSLSIAPDGL